MEILALQGTPEAVHPTAGAMTSWVGLNPSGTVPSDPVLWSTAFFSALIDISIKFDFLLMLLVSTVSNPTTNDSFVSDLPFN